MYINNLYAIQKYIKWDTDIQPFHAYFLDFLKQIEVKKFFCRIHATFEINTSLITPNPFHNLLQILIWKTISLKSTYSVYRSPKSLII